MQQFPIHFQDTKHPWSRSWYFNTKINTAIELIASSIIKLFRLERLFYDQNIFLIWESSE